MKQILLLISAVIFWQFISLAKSEDTSLKLVYPTPEVRLEITGKPFYLIGTVTPANAKLKINDSEAQVSSDGAFICMSKIIVFKKDGENLGKFIFDISDGNGGKRITKILK